MSKRRQEEVDAACELARLSAQATRALRPNKGAYRRLHQKHQLGRVVAKDWLAFDVLARQALAQWLERSGIDPSRGIPTEPVSRTELAGAQLDEKTGAGAIAAHHRLLALAPAGTALSTINARALTLPRGGSLTLPRAAIEAVEADWLLTVENYETFLALSAHPGRLNRDGRGLIVLRTSPAFPAGMGWARELAAEHGIEHWHAPDVDPQGLSHCFEQSLAGAWLPTIDSLDAEWPRNHALFDRQQGAVEKLPARCAGAFPGLLPWVSWVRQEQAGVSQERAFAQGLRFAWVPNR